MKNNTKRTKELLHKTILSLPSDFSLSEVRFHLKQALDKINKTEKKRHNRADVQDPAKYHTGHTGLVPFAGGSFNEMPSSETIEVINQMIQEEKDKLDSFKSLNDQTLFG